MSCRYKFHSWFIRADDGGWCIYQSNIGKVTEIHVESAPSVKRWAGGRKITLEPYDAEKAKKPKGEIRIPD